MTTLLTPGVSGLFLKLCDSLRQCFPDHRWNYAFLAQCMIPVLDRVTSTSSTGYAAILELDNRIRNFDTPPALQFVDIERSSTKTVMQQAMATCTRDISMTSSGLSAYI